MKRIQKGISLLTLAGLVLSLSACSNSKNISSRTVNTPAAESSASESSVQDTSTVTPERSEENSDSSEASRHQDASGFEVPEEFRDNGIFSAYYDDAYKYVLSMSTDEKIGQMIWSGRPSQESIELAKYHYLGGYVLFGNDFAGRTKEALTEELSQVVYSHRIPLAIAVDEEGGTVTRISDKKELSDHAFESPRDLYKRGGMAYIQSDANEKASLLKQLHIDVNLAPVCDIATNAGDFMYQRSLGEDAATTGEFVRVVTEISQSTGVSVTLKHFPGYGGNTDTHTGLSVDNRTREEFRRNDFIPFQSGIQAGAHFVMVSHNTITAVDADMPASLSASVHQILRKELGFTGLIITDDLAMGAISKITKEQDPAVTAILAGNDIAVVGPSMVSSSFQALKNAYSTGVLSDEILNHAAMRIIAWKMMKGIM